MGRGNLAKDSKLPPNKIHGIVSEFEGRDWKCPVTSMDLPAVGRRTEGLRSAGLNPGADHYRQH